MSHGTDTEEALMLQGFRMLSPEMKVAARLFVANLVNVIYEDRDAEMARKVIPITRHLSR